MLKKIMLMGVMAVLLLSMPSCERHVKNPRSCIRRDESEAILSLTEDQKTFLIENSFDEEAVREGRIKNWQIELLEKYDLAMDYLNSNYAGHTFQITTYENVTSTFTKFVVIPDEEEENVFTVSVRNEDGRILITDTYSN